MIVDLALIYCYKFIVSRPMLFIPFIYNISVFKLKLNLYLLFCFYFKGVAWCVIKPEPVAKLPDADYVSDGNFYNGFDYWFKYASIYARSEVIWSISSCLPIKSLFRIFPSVFSACVVWRAYYSFIYSSIESLSPELSFLLLDEY